MRNFALAVLFTLVSILSSACSLSASRTAAVPAAQPPATPAQAECARETLETCRREHETRFTPMVLFSMATCENRVNSCYQRPPL